MQDIHRVFGVGTVRMGAVGATLDSTNDIGDVQSASLDATFQRKELFNSPEISAFAVAMAYYGGKVEIKVNWENLNRKAIQFTTGSTATSSGGITTLSITKTTRPGYFRCELLVPDEQGNPVKVILYNASAPGLTMALSIDDYLKSDSTITGYPDPTTGKVCDILSND